MCLYDFEEKYFDNQEYYTLNISSYIFFREDTRIRLCEVYIQKKSWTHRSFFGGHYKEKIIHVGEKINHVPLLHESRNPVWRAVLTSHSSHVSPNWRKCDWTHNPLMPNGVFNIFCPRDCVSRHNGGTTGAPLKPLRVWRNRAA